MNLKRTISIALILIMVLIDFKIIIEYKTTQPTEKYGIVEHKKTAAQVLDLSSIQPEEIYEIALEEPVDTNLSEKKEIVQEATVEINTAEIPSEPIEEKISEPVQEVVSQEPEPVQETISEVIEEPVAPVQNTETPEESNSSLSSSIVETALQYKGYNYVSGGASPETGFDCSGFTKYIFGLYGINLNRVSGDQASNGTPISKSELQPGDLVLFSYYGSDSIGHSGIYIGNGNFVHAANSKRGVVVDTLESGYYLENYVTARRLF